MSKDDIQRELVPRLRFPEFRESPAWRSTRLGDALKFQPGYPFPSSGFNEGGIGLRLIRNRDLRSDDAVIYYSSSYDEAFVVNDGDVLIGMDGDFTPCLWDKGQALLNQRVGRIAPKAKNDLQFLRYFLTAHLKDIEDATPRTTVKHLSHSDVERLHEVLPEPAEQRKIADCLGSLDDLIAAEGRKLAGLRDHKKGLMQQLFPREGETRPQRRFPEFQDASDWKVRPLAQVAENLDSRRIPITEKDRTEGEIPYYGASGIVDYVADYIFDEELLCISEDGANLLARTYPIAFSISGKTWVNNHAHVLRFDEPARQTLVEAYLNVTDLRDYITGMAQPKLNRGMLDTIPISLPHTPAEQQRIADCLASLDAMIAAQAEKLDALRTHKRGLMQQLFPSPEEG